MVATISQDKQNSQIENSALSRRMRIGIALLVVAMIVILAVGYLTFSRYIDFVNGR